MGKKKPRNKELVLFAEELLKQLQGQKHPYKLLANELNRVNRFGTWTSKSIWSYLYRHGTAIPRKKVVRGLQDKGTPTEKTIPEGCVSEDEALRYIAICIAECPTDKNPFAYASEKLNQEDIFITPGSAKWLPGKTEKFYRLNTRDEPTNRLREKFLQHQIRPIPELVDYVLGLKESGFTHEAIVAWLNQENIIHHRWQLQEPIWNKAQLSSLLSSNKKRSRRRGRQSQKPQQPVLDFVAANPGHTIMTPDEIIVYSYEMRRKGFEWSGSQLALRLNRTRVVRSNYTRGSPEFTAPIVINIFSHRGLQYSQDEPAWVTEKIAEKKAALEVEPTTEPGWSLVVDKPKKPAPKTVEPAAPEPVVPEPVVKPSVVEAGVMVTLPEVTNQTDTFTATANVVIGPGRLKLTLKYDGAPDALLAATLEKLLGMKIQY